MEADLCQQDELHLPPFFLLTLIKYIGFCRGRVHRIDLPLLINLTLHDWFQICISLDEVNESEFIIWTFQYLKLLAPLIKEVMGGREKVKVIRLIRSRVRLIKSEISS